MRVEEEDAAPGALNPASEDAELRRSTPYYARLLDESDGENPAPSRADNLRDSDREQDAVEERPARKPIGISNSRNRNNTRRASDVRRDEEDEAREEDRDARTVRDSRGDTYIRGQVNEKPVSPNWSRPFSWLDVNRSVPYKEAPESSRYKIFKWSILGI